MLVRRAYYFNHDHSKYEGLGFYPDREYQSFLELGGVMQALLILRPSLASALLFYLRSLCYHLVRGARYRETR
jgi:hypothetical protein